LRNPVALYAVAYARTVGRIIGGGVVKGLGERLRSRREALGLSQGDLAERITAQRRKRQKPVNRISMSLFENDKRIPSAASLVELADALQCSVDYLLGRIDQPTGTTAASSPQEATTAPKAPIAPAEPPKPTEGTEGGPSLEAMQAQADKAGRNTVLWRGRLYMRRRQGWESVQ
jgi:transcriptional regulator with XRE-family HTH domain